MPETTARHIGIISVRGMDYHPTRRLAEAARARGCRLSVIHPYRVRPVLTGNRPGLSGPGAVAGLDAVLPRQGAEIRDACLPLVAHLAQMGVVIINGPAGILAARNQFWTLQALAAAGIPVPDTTFVPAADDPSELWHGAAADTLVVKPVSGRQGKGIQRLERHGAPLDPELAAALIDGRGVLVQSYLDPAGRADIRVLVVGQAVAGAMRLAPADGDFRSNFHLTGRAEAVDLPANLARIAVRSTRALGLDVSGVDIMVAADGRILVNEVNYAPGFRGLESVTGRDIAGCIMDYTLARIAAHAADRHGSDRMTS